MAKKPARAKPAAKPASRAKKRTSSTKSKTNIAPSDDPDFILHSLQEEFEAAKSFAASDEQKLEFYRQMLLIRRFEEKAGQLYGLGLIGGFCHLYIGKRRLRLVCKARLMATRIASSPATVIMATCSPMALIPM